MSNNLQRGPFSSIVRAIYLLIQGRIHFPKDRLGEIVNEGEEFEIFRHMTLDPDKDQPEKPGAMSGIPLLQPRITGHLSL